MEDRRIIGVIGAGECDGALYEKAKEAGSLIAAAGFVLLSGGLGGVMEASARGAKEAGGVTVGILPGTDPGSANDYIDIPIPTGIGDMRNALIVRSSAGLIAVGGGVGTLSEIALALKAGKPVISIGSWDISEEVVKAATPAEAVKLLIKSIA